MKRTVTPELLDSDSGSPAEIAASLADLRMVTGAVSVEQSCNIGPQFLASAQNLSAERAVDSAAISVQAALELKLHAT